LQSLRDPHERHERARPASRDVRQGTRVKGRPIQDVAREPCSCLEIRATVTHR